jgi:hypothetical protein
MHIFSFVKLKVKLKWYINSSGESCLLLSTFKKKFREEKLYLILWYLGINIVLLKNMYPCGIEYSLSQVVAVITVPKNLFLIFKT